MFDSTLSGIRARKTLVICHPVSFSLQNSEPGCDVPNSTLLEGINEVQPGESFLYYEILFKAGEVVAVRHGRRREQWGFYLAILLKDLLVKDKAAHELQFTDKVMDILWLDNSDTGDIFLFKEAYEDHQNSPYSVVDGVCADVCTGDSGSKSYRLQQEEVNRTERILKGGAHSDIESKEELDENEVASDDTSPVEHPSVFLATQDQGALQHV